MYMIIKFLKMCSNACGAGTKTYLLPSMSENIKSVIK